MQLYGGKQWRQMQGHLQAADCPAKAVWPLRFKTSIYKSSLHATHHGEDYVFIYFSSIDTQYKA